MFPELTETFLEGIAAGVGVNASEIDVNLTHAYELAHGGYRADHHDIAWHTSFYREVCGGMLDPCQ